MAKTAAERVREYMARKRVQARQFGLCTQCYKGKPKAGRTVCIECRASIDARIRRKRKERHEVVKLQQAIAIQERAGDMASMYHLYADATHYYQEVLDVPTLTSTDRERIAEKIGHTFFLNGDFKAANRWSERLLMAYEVDPKKAAKSIETLFQIHRQLTWDCDGEALSALTRAVKLAERSGDGRLIKLAQLRRVDALQVVMRFEEASQALQEIGDLSEDRDDTLRSYYFGVQGWAAGFLGNLKDAYANFEFALELVKKDLDPFRVSNIWGRYGIIAHELGDSLRAKACFEQALFVAGQYQMRWRIAHLSLLYAKLLACMGQSTAYLYLTEALSSRPVPFLDMHKASIGIPLALQARDEVMLAQCARPERIELAFQSEMPSAIGGIGHAFAQLYVSQEHPRLAQSLLQRAIKKIAYAHFNFDLLIAIAQHGALTDIPKARALLEVRTRMPHAEVSQAGLALFDAFVEQRRGSLTEAYTHARDAIARLDALRWYGYAEQVRSLFPGTDVPAQRSVESTPFSHMPALTTREREVAALVLRGLTNPEIAKELNIALHTVEKHMNSILTRLGVRSRYQVADVLESVSDKDIS